MWLSGSWVIVDNWSVSPFDVLVHTLVFPCLVVSWTGKFWVLNISRIAQVILDLITVTVLRSLFGIAVFVAIGVGGWVHLSTDCECETSKKFDHKISYLILKD